MNPCGLFAPFVPHCAYKPRIIGKDARDGFYDRNQATA